MSKNVTKNQHYVPQVYLRGFSKDYEPGIKVPEKGRVYGYDLINRFQSLDVPIESVCRETYLYEIKNDDGFIISPNYIEKALGRMESQFPIRRNELERKNFLFPMDDRLRRIVFDSISLNASRWIFANHKMGAEELSWIDMIIEQQKDQ